MNCIGILVAAASLAVIGAFHPIVIKCEYHFGSRVWWGFLVAGLLLLGASLFLHGFLCDLCALVGAGSLWSIIELKQQEKRVERGWFPRNPKRK